MLQNDPDRMAMISGGEPMPEIIQRLNAAVNTEVKLAKEFGDDYFNAGTDEGLLGAITGRFSRGVLDSSGKGLKAYTEMQKINNDLEAGFTDEQLANMLNKGYQDAELPYRFELPKDDREKKAEGELVGGQKELDRNNDGDITAEDFKMLREGKQEGGLLSDEREKYLIGGIVKAVSKLFSPPKTKLKPEETKIFKFALTKSEQKNIQKQLDENLETINWENRFGDKFSLPQKEFNNQMIEAIYIQPKTMAQFKRSEIENYILGKKREGMQEGGMMMEEQMKMLMEEQQVPDDEMEEDYLDFIINEALTPEEEDFLVDQLRDNDELSEIFDKVIEVASEFTGSGPVEGPGTGVSDSIPARLSDGEFVFTAKATEQIGVDKLMSMMKEAEAAADERQGMQEGGVLSETTTTTRRFADPTQIEDEEEVMQDEKTIQDMRATNPRMQ